MGYLSLSSFLFETCVMLLSIPLYILCSCSVLHVGKVTGINRTPHQMGTCSLEFLEGGSMLWALAMSLGWRFTVLLALQALQLGRVKGIMDMEGRLREDSEKWIPLPSYVLRLCWCFSSPGPWKWLEKTILNKEIGVGPWWYSGTSPNMMNWLQEWRKT